MRFGFVFAVLAMMGIGVTRSLASAGAPPAQPEIIARVHFVGLSQISADTNSAKLRELAALPETEDLQTATLQKLATAPYRFLKPRINPDNSNDYSRVFRVMLDDWLRAESYLEVRGSTNPVPDFMLALRLDKDQAEVWRTNLSIVLTAWTGIPVVAYRDQGFEGWELRKHDYPNRIRFLRAGDWTLFGWGQDELPLQSAMLQRIKDRKRPVEAAKNYWLDASVDWPRLAPLLPAVGRFNFPKMHLILEGRADFLRPQLVMQFPEPLKLALEPWHLPTNTIHSPIISFTAMRGMASWLSGFPPIKSLNAAPLPNELFVWASEQIPIETCVAAYIMNASNYLERIGPGLISRLNSKFPSGPMKVEAAWTTNREIQVHGMPVIVPYVKAIHEPAGDFLLGGFFPSPRRDKPLPAELLNELTGRSNLVYYDWEITAGRLQQWRGLFQFYFMASGLVPPAVEAPAQKWLDAARPKLGNCATHITQTGPNELTLVRNSAIGFTGFELFWLAYWLDAQGFPMDVHLEKNTRFPGPGMTPVPR